MRHTVFVKAPLFLPVGYKLPECDADCIKSAASAQLDKVIGRESLAWVTINLVWDECVADLL